MNLRVGILFLLSTLLAGCGYRQTGSFDEKSATPNGYQWRSLYREDVHSVAVPIFVNRTYYRGVEFTLTNALVKQIELKAPYKVLDKSKADTILEGQIVEVHTRQLSQGRSNALPQEQLSSVKVNFVWKDLRSGAILSERRGFERAAPFYPTLGEGRTVGQQEAVEALATAIAEELQSDW